jgi:hypothetical protein
MFFDLPNAAALKLYTQSIVSSYRKLDERRQPVDTRAFIGVPVHSFKSTDAIPLPDYGNTPVLLQFRLMPTSFLWRKGQRIRVSIGGADVRHFSPLLTGVPITKSSQCAVSIMHLITCMYVSALALRLKL